MATIQLPHTQISVKFYISASMKKKWHENNSFRNVHKKFIYNILHTYICKYTLHAKYMAIQEYYIVFCKQGEEKMVQLQ